MYRNDAITELYRELPIIQDELKKCSKTINRKWS